MPVSRVPAKVTTKMAERAEYERKLKEEESKEEEEEDLEVIGENGDRKMDVDEEPAERRKRQRPVVDPFAGAWSFVYPYPLSLKPTPASVGYGDEPTTDTPAEDSFKAKAPSGSSSEPQQKKKKTASSITGAKKKKQGKKKVTES